MYVEGQALTKKENENVPFYALKDQQLVKEAVKTSPLQLLTSSVQKLSLEGYHNSWGNFSHKQQVKHTSNVMVPTIPFYTLVKLVDLDNITNGNVRSLDIPLEIVK